MTSEVSQRQLQSAAEALLGKFIQSGEEENSMKHKEDEKARVEEECGDYPVLVMFSVKTNTSLCSVTSLFLACTEYIERQWKQPCPGKLLYDLPTTHALSLFCQAKPSIQLWVYSSACMSLSRYVN